MSNDEEKPLLTEDKEQPIEFWRELIDLSSMALQVSLATFTRIALTSIDSAFLGHLGTEELAAASLAQVWTSVPLMGVWAAASALITLCGQAWGAGNRELTGIWLQFGLIITGIFGLPVFVWYWCLGWVLQYSTPDAIVVELGSQFAKVLAFSITPSLAYACMRQYFQSMGIMWPTTLVGTTSIGLTVLCNYLFIYGCFGWKGMGFIGSPLATVVASWFQPIALYLICVTWKGYHKEAWFGWDFKALTWERLKVFSKIAGPVASNSLVSNLANSMVTLIAAHMGSDVIAANAVLSGLWSVLWALFWGFGCATQVRVANYMGAGRPKAAKTLAVMGSFCTGVCVAVLAIVVLSLENGMFAIYSNDPHILELCRGVAILFVIAFCTESCEIVVGAVLTGMGKVNVIFWCSLLATWCIDLPLCYYLGIKRNMGLSALWYAIFAMEVFKLGAFLFDLLMTDWKFQSDMCMMNMETKDEDAAIEAEESETQPMVGQRRGSMLDKLTGNSAAMEPSIRDRRASQALVDRRLSASVFQGPNPTL